MIRFRPNPSYSVALIAALKAAGMSQIELARRVGCSRAIISQYCAGNKLPRRGMVARINDVLGTNLSPVRGITVKEVARDMRLGEETVRRGFKCGQLSQIGVAIPSPSGKRCRFVVWANKYKEFVTGESEGVLNAVA